VKTVKTSVVIGRSSRDEQYEDGIHPSSWIDALCEVGENVLQSLMENTWPLGCNELEAVEPAVDSWFDEPVIAEWRTPADVVSP
jgi:hypothetical protein